MDSVSKAGTLMFLRLVFADEMAGSTLPLMAVGAASLLGQAALANPQQRQLTLKQLRRRTAAVPRRFRRAAAEMASGKAVLFASPPPGPPPTSLWVAPDLLFDIPLPKNPPLPSPFGCPGSCPPYTPPPPGAAPCPPKAASLLLQCLCAYMLC